MNTLSTGPICRPPKGGRDIPVWKRALDFAGLFLLLPAALPIMGLVALGIYLVSPGPVLFRQQRIGLRGRRFVCFKFRSMIVAADTTGHQKHLAQLVGSKAPMTKMDSSDTRLIPFGSVLRASGLDELPQLFNVLRGDMSLVGPRPCIPYEYEMYREWEKRRFESVPGLTGLWQVNGKNSTTFREMIALDIYYSRHKSPLLDLQILLRTFPAVFGQVNECLKKRSLRKKSEEPLRRKRSLFADLF